MPAIGSSALAIVMTTAARSMSAKGNLGLLCWLPQSRQTNGIGAGLSWLAMGGPSPLSMASGRQYDNWQRFWFRKPVCGPEIQGVGKDWNHERFHANLGGTRSFP